MTLFKKIMGKIKNELSIDDINEMLIEPVFHNICMKISPYIILLFCMLIIIIVLLSIIIHRQNQFLGKSF